MKNNIYNLLTIKEASEALRISVVTLRRLIKKQLISFHRIGKKIYFTDDDINEFISSNFYPKKAG